MHWVIGTSIAVGIVVLMYIGNIVLGVSLTGNFPKETVSAINLGFTGLYLVAGSAWVALDSKKIEISKYQSGLPNKPLLLFFCGVLLFLPTLIWYFSVKTSIKRGTAQLKERR